MDWTRIVPMLVQTPDAIAERDAVLAVYPFPAVCRAATTYCACVFGLTIEGEAIPRSDREAAQGLATAFAMLAATIQ